MTKKDDAERRGAATGADARNKWLLCDKTPAKIRRSDEIRRLAPRPPAFLLTRQTEQGILTFAGYYTNMTHS